eukprot:gene4610-7239_t
MPYFQKPESAMKKAQELIKVDQPAMALEVLHDVLTSRRHRTWSNTHELIMKKYIDLCILLKKGRLARDGLHQFKNIAGTTAVSSMENVIRYYLDSAAKRVAEAQAHLDGAMTQLDEIEDLDAAETPESILLAMVSDEGTRNRTQKAVLAPWVKFLWEAYRTVLEILRNNSKLEVLYQETAQEGFKFCMKFQRKMEFRRLCELLRYQLTNSQKYQNQVNAVDLANPETLQLHLETRFEQLNTAAKMDLWQEAFKAIEDINNLMELSKKAPKPQMLAMFYQKLAMVLWKSNDYTFHAMAWSKLFLISKEHKKLATEEAQNKANCVLLSALSVPILNSGPDDTNHLTTSNVTERHAKLAELVGANAVPTRDELIENLTLNNIVHYVEPALKDLYNYMEEEFHPLTMGAKINPILEFLAKNERLAHYVKPLQHTLMVRLLKQLSQVYASIKLDRLVEIVPFADVQEIEAFLVQIAKDRVVQFRVSHRDRSIIFGTTTLVADEPENGPQLQSLQSQVMRGQLTTLSRRLTAAVNMIDPEKQKREAADRHQAVYDGLAEKMEREHNSVLERKQTIETRKEFIETQQHVKHQEARFKAKQDRDDMIAKEAKRLEEDEKKRVAKKAKDAERKMEDDKKRDKLQTYLNTPVGQKAFEAIDEAKVVTMTEAEIDALQITHLEKMKSSTAIRLKTNHKKYDYTERARRLLEVPLLEAGLETAKKEWLADSKAKHAAALQVKEQLSKMVSYKQAFVTTILEQRDAEYQEAYDEFDRAMAAQRAARQREEDLRREREELEEEERQQRLEDEERMRQEEEERRAVEAEAEAERRKVEEAERAVRDAQRREQEAADREALDLADAKRKEREAEIDARGGGRGPPQ